MTALLLAPVAYADAAYQTEFTTATLLSEVKAVPPGQTFTLALRLVTKEGWHSYWQNPGDSGMITTLAWQLPPGFSAGQIEWPAPIRLPMMGLMNYGYAREATLLVPIAPPAALDTHATYRFAVQANWLVCKDICVPETTTLDLTLPAGSGSEKQAGSDSAIITTAQKALPQPLQRSLPYRIEDETVVFVLPRALVSEAALRSFDFFPVEDGVVLNNAVPQLRAEKDTVEIRLPRGKQPAPALFHSVVTFAGAAPPLAVTWEKNGALPPSPAIAPAETSSSTADSASAAGLLEALLLAFLGGIVLNVMPCVLPILSLKVLNLATTSNPAARRQEGMAYTLGVLASFAFLAGLLMVLQRGGAAIGWGYQMQSPVFVTFLIYLMFAIGLNLSGVFELPVLLGEAATRFGARQSWLAHFATGALATLVATPCSAPFMGIAVAYALTRPSLEALLVFEALGLGLALPYLAIAWAPRLHSWLPRPGAWTIRLRQLLAFPMYATCAWLLWVLTQQAGADGLATALMGCLALALAAWSWPLLAERYRWWRLVLLAVALAFAGATFWMYASPRGCALPATSHIEHGQRFSEEQLQKLRAQGVPVLVNVTASWCITCKVNEHLALGDTEVQQALARKHVQVLVADWTERDAIISNYLAGFNRRGVPLYVFYPQNHPPIILPQLLSRSGMLALLNGV